ncbi:MAG: anthranilate phosphoribosyltransferase [Omnitrophica WOR_2 bacterium SM23_72]|nr:MAG: anthranilate phosphoribosyltransferase [Omnitrophica WOR_2 bacterium SM23_72]
MIQQCIESLSKGENLSSAFMQSTMEEIMTGQVDTQDIVSFLTHLNQKGETVEELTAAAQIMRKHAICIRSKHKVILDTCGTGGDQSGLFNVSTAVAFVAAGCGIAVAKHGNRSVSSFCGSADILEALGIDILMGKEKIETCLDEIGIAFLFAQNLHPAMKYAMPARKQIGKRTMFNILGPLTNPAGATHQLIGVFDKRWTQVLAEVLGKLGSVHSLIVHGEDGLDEISTVAKTHICEQRRGTVRNFQLDSEAFGLGKARREDLIGGKAQDNARILVEILKGEPGCRREIVLLNAAAAIYVADRASSIQEGLALAQESIDSGKAYEKLELLRTYSSR